MKPGGRWISRNRAVVHCISPSHTHTHTRAGKADEVIKAGHRSLLHLSKRYVTLLHPQCRRSCFPDAWPYTAAYHRRGPRLSPAAIRRCLTLHLDWDTLSQRWIVVSQGTHTHTYTQILSLSHPLFIMRIRSINLALFICPSGQPVLDGSVHDSKGAKKSSQSDGV